MTVPAAERKAGPFNGNGSTTEFPFEFKVFTTADVEVVFADTDGVETVLELDSDYSVELNADQDATPGGTVTYPISGTALATGEKLSVAGAIAYEQETDIPTGGNFNPTVLENALDKLSMQTQQLAEAVARAAKIPITRTEDAEELSAAILLAADNIVGLQVIVANIDDIQTVADDLNEATSEINTVATSIANVDAVGTNIDSVVAVDANEANINAVVANETNIDTVAGVSADVTTVAGIAGDVSAVENIAANVTSVAGNATNINAVAGNATNINAVAGNATNINAVAGNATNINAVNANKTNIDTAATNIAAIIDAPSQAAAAAASALAAAASAASGMYSSVQDKSADYTVVAGDAGDLIRVSTSGGARTITLPAISSVTDGFKVAVAKWSGDSNAVTIARSSTDLINGATTYVLDAQYKSATFVADAETNTWFAAGTGGGGTNIIVDAFSGNGSTVAFTLSGDAGSENNTQVFVGGVYQEKDTYSLSGTTLTFSSAPPSGTSNIEVVWSTPLAIGVPSDGTVSTAKLADGAVTPAKMSSGAPTWDTSGNVGIGTSSPNYKLQVKAATNQNFTVGGAVNIANSVSLAAVNDANNANIPVEMRYATNFAWIDSGTERMRIDASGNLILSNSIQEKKTAMAANDINLSTGNYFTKTISGTTTFTVSNVPSTGTAASFILDLTNGGSASITWWSGVKWAGGTAPTLTSSGRDVLGFFTHDGGTTWSGLVLGKDLK